MDQVEKYWSMRRNLVPMTYQNASQKRHREHRKHQSRRYTFGGQQKQAVSLPLLEPVEIALKIPLTNFQTFQEVCVILETLLL